MSSRLRNLLIVAMVVPLVACIAGFVITLPPPFPLQYQQAHQRWIQHGIRHYQVEVIWANGWSAGHARVEMRDNQFVQGIDLDTGQPLATGKLLQASYFASMDHLFSLLDERVWSALNWRIVLSRYHPLLERWLKPCVPPLSAVSYDAEYGYPTYISFNNGWCTRGFFTYSQVTIKQFTPL